MFSNGLIVLTTVLGVSICVIVGVIAFRYITVDLGILTVKSSQVVALGVGSPLAGSSLVYRLSNRVG
ncbi:hypothetical protein N7468_008572 [Penicillium chermesinum]|uniref:Uncharacterized protein n=1 Tax=Penicillium chermesinum TaxID=63820 RepID=A0A9W9TK00_9EURO|nr:uncharacterized protein N7468_008572 [Penicillium chermesinum]KAJ5224030.1 hypothetical protein N7468_008572 [Penicillium chermesinum]